MVAVVDLCAGFASRWRPCAPFAHPSRWQRPCAADVTSLCHIGSASTPARLFDFPFSAPHSAVSQRAQLSPSGRVSGAAPPRNARLVGCELPSERRQHDESVRERVKQTHRHRGRHPLFSHRIKITYPTSAVQGFPLIPRTASPLLNQFN
jgi:hypothetical protein